MSLFDNVQEQLEYMATVHSHLEKKDFQEVCDKTQATPLTYLFLH
jgi:hypothetical protein